jgi:hypothetical protein
MKLKIVIVIFLLISLKLNIYAKQVDENKATIVAANFLKSNNIYQHALFEVCHISEKNYTNRGVIKHYYIYNFNNTGFVIISADDIVEPILAYSTESTFEYKKMPPSVKYWLLEIENGIEQAILTNQMADSETETKWLTLLNDTEQPKILSAQSVNPLVLAKWNQDPFYNDLCPFDVQSNQRTVVGCVATAMAQIMKYWSYPAKGVGFHSYNHQKYGTLSANFSSATYNWSAMPNSINSANSEIAKISYHCGIGVSMNYGIGSTGGSSAYVIDSHSPIVHCAEYAFKTYFGYRNTLQGVQRTNYTQTQWINLLKQELDQSRPIMYAGFGSGGGHAFVCDGYDNNNFFHFNWGWGGAYDGYFSINALNPQGTGTGGGTGGFNTGHQAIIGLQPPANILTYDLRLNNFITPSSYNVNYGDAFSVTANLVNSGTNTFNGDYCIAAFDEAFKFVDYIQVRTGFTLQGGYTYTNDLNFSTQGIDKMIPGEYYLAMFYRPTGGNWIMVSNNGNFQNNVKITVIYESDIEIISPLVVAPATLVQGQAVSVNFNVMNFGSSTFTGIIEINLYDLDFNFVENLGTYTENVGLPTLNSYTNPLSFTKSSVNANPGTYYIAVIYKYSNWNFWDLAGSFFEKNPIRINIVLPPIQPDQYEPNNITSQSFNLPVIFNNNISYLSTSNANCHLGNDYDYYKLELSDGYKYSVIMRLHDSYNSGNGNVYTLDALLSYSTNGIDWSDAIDDIMTDSIHLEGLSTLNLLISPFYLGETGTYQLDYIIKREELPSSIKDNNAQTYTSVFPNPANESVIINFNKEYSTSSNVQLINTQGQITFSKDNIIDDNVNIDISTFAKGIYIARVTSAGNTENIKLIIR